VLKKLLSYLLAAAIIISLTFAGCAETGTNSPSTNTPADEELTEQDEVAQSEGETGESDGSDSDANEIDDGEDNEETITTGGLEIRVTDAPPEEEVTSILVTISSIEIHRAVAEQEEEQEGGNEQNQEQEQEQEEQSGDGWLTLDITGDNPFDLIELRDEGVTALLAVEELEVGKYTQIRILIDEVWVTLGEGEPQEAKLPSDELKLIQPFDIEEGQVTVITVDFDAAESVNVTGQDDIIVQPVVKLTVEYTTES